jgi:hypothetical protein
MIHFLEVSHLVGIVGGLVFAAALGIFLDSRD